MAVTVETESTNVITLQVNGKLHKEDYKHLRSQNRKADREAREGPHPGGDEGLPRVGRGALWEDVKFDLQHFGDIERLAMIGDKKWERGMAQFCRPFTKAKIQYFEESERAAAQAWVKGD